MIRLTVNAIEWRAADDPLLVAEATLELVRALETICYADSSAAQVAQDALARFEKKILEK